MALSGRANISVSEKLILKSMTMALRVSASRSPNLEMAAVSRSEARNCKLYTSWRREVLLLCHCARSERKDAATSSCATAGCGAFWRPKASRKPNAMMIPGNVLSAVIANSPISAEIVEAIQWIWLVALTIFVIPKQWIDWISWRPDLGDKPPSSPKKDKYESEQPRP